MEKYKNSDQKFSVRRRFSSFRYAWEGIVSFFREEHNARIHLVSSIIAIGLSYFLKISLREWFAILLSICFVFVCELFNTALENVCDMISKEEHQAIKKAKDQAAAAVLIASVFALIIGAFVFLPKILDFVGGG